ncbi:hypothetical protein NE237_019573 [Protea cynaroides]|uniref:Uncharacterized protein n=1 Tax=Protea cynaroides TaxID=273540 RepID=A0A9Q0H7D7_9MAGN|nr:hypothetical protein NE237_019573 [Protea cynaroides]
MVYYPENASSGPDGLLPKKQKENLNVEIVDRANTQVLKTKTNFSLTSEINNNTNNQQSPNLSSTVESSSREGFSLAPPLALDLCGGSGGGSCVGSSGGFAMRSSFHHHPHHQQFGVLPTVHPFFFFDPFVRSENKNMNHHYLSFDPVVTATVDFQAAFAGGVNGAQSVSDSSI